MRFGVTALPGAATTATVAAFPKARYMRDFGKDADGDRLPDLTPYGTGKWLVKPTGCLLHCSLKGDVEPARAVLDGLREDCWWTFHHEPMGDLTPAVYRDRATRMVQIKDSHPNGHFVVHNGPVVTRYWLCQKGGNPLDWWYEGATFYGVDVYNDEKTRYRPPEELFGEPFARIRAALPGVPIVVPEFGLALVAGDDGTERARMMRGHADYLKRQPDVLAVGWWDIGGNQIRDREPERSTWRQIIEEATPVAWYLNRALSNMRAEVNARYPNRDRTSDGTIGDEAHQSTSSDHNPDTDGSVDAWDMDVNLRSSNDAAAIEWLKQRFQAHESSRYWIHNRTIASRDIDNWRRRPYDGANPHDKHVHFNTREQFEDSDEPWGIGGDMELDDLLNHRLKGNGLPVDGVPVADAWKRIVLGERNINAKLDAVLAAILNVDEEVVAKLGAAAETSVEEKADLLRAVLGDDAHRVGELLVAG